MNRLFHLEQTYLKNIKNASTYPDVEFVLLDYNSKDGLEQWARDNLLEHIENGKVKFYKTLEPIHWIAAHAKNIAHKLASGDILCNLDCDILIPEGFCEYINEAFSSDKRIVMCFDSKDAYGNDGCAGLVSALREDFYSVNGYDESISMGWGCDDMNYQFRVRMQNDLFMFVPPPICLCIPHSNEVRTANCQLKNIEMTSEMSLSLCQDVALSKDYVANKSHHWGKAKIRDLQGLEKQI